jgi:AcrR family transcriptional regulator
MRPSGCSSSEVYQSASLDEIAATAPASKPTIYAHFPEEALFDAVVARVIEGLTDFEGFAPKGARCRTSSRAWASRSWKASSTRRSASRARQSPKQADRVRRWARPRRGCRVPCPERCDPHPFARVNGPFDPKRSVSTAQIFMDLILLPMIMRALERRERGAQRTARFRARTRQLPHGSL